MPNTFTQIYIQFVFAIKFQHATIEISWKERLHKYITGIIQNHGHKLIAINSMPDHIHIFVGCKPHQSISDLMRIVKGDSSEWINNEKLTPALFRWQEGFGAFSYSLSQIHSVAKYIEDQEKHHSKKTFLEEYVQFLKIFEIEYDEKYIFKPLE